MRLEPLSARYETGFLLFVGVLAFLGRENPSLQYPQALYLFLLLMALNLAAGVALRLRPAEPGVSAIFILANCAVISGILRYSGGASSNLWVLYLLPIFTVCLLLGPRETAWVTSGVVIFNAAFILLEGREAGTVVAFEVMLKSGFFLFTALLTWRLASRERETRQKLRVEVDRAEMLETKIQSSAALSDVGLVGAGVAHDLKNTFMTVAGFAEMALEDGGLSPETRHSLERVRRLSALGAETAKQLSLHGAEAALELKDEDLGEIARGVAALVRGTFLAKGVDLDVGGADVALPIKASRVHLQRVFLNLLLNALSVSGKGRRVRVELTRGDGEARAAVEDQGPGFPPELLPRLFSAYATGRAEQGGTGLGLNICARVAREHGGRLSAENRPEGGARLVVVLPLARA